MYGTAVLAGTAASGEVGVIEHPAFNTTISNGGNSGSALRVRLRLGNMIKPPRLEKLFIFDEDRQREGGRAGDRLLSSKGNLKFVYCKILSTRSRLCSEMIRNVSTLAQWLIALILVMWVTLSSATGLKTEFIYDAVGNLRHLTAPNGETSYDYDVVNRVTGESGPAATTTYTYDANGNRLTGDGATLTYPSSSTPSNRISTRQVGSTTFSYVYDSTAHGSTGNVVDDGVYQYTYTLRGQVKQVKQGAATIATYSYDYQNRRTRKVVGATVTVYHYDQGGRLIAETSSGNDAQKTYAYRDGVPVGQIDHASTVKATYLFSDNLGTPRLGRDIAKNIIWTWNSDAFGSAAANSDPDGNSVNTNVNLRFAGQYFDAESALHYNWSRVYDPKIGRYLQSDPIGLDGGLNVYAYANSNPLTDVDPTGTVAGVDDVTAIILLGGAAAAAAAEAAGICLTNPDGSPYNPFEPLFSPSSGGNPKWNPFYENRRGERNWEKGKGDDPLWGKSREELQDIERNDPDPKVRKNAQKIRKQKEKKGKA